MAILAGPGEVRPKGSARADPHKSWGGVLAKMGHFGQKWTKWPFYPLGQKWSKMAIFDIFGQVWSAGLNRSAILATFWRFGQKVTGFLFHQNRL